MLKKLSMNTGNKLYSIMGWFCYVACTIISAILNIYLLSKLDQSWAWFLLTMSLSLEFGKAYILIKANTYRSLAEYLKNCNFNNKKVIHKEKTFYSIYVLFAILSITASLCFSLTITDKTEQGFSLQKQEITQNLNSVEKSQLKYEETLEKYTYLQDNSDVNEKEAKDLLRIAEDNYNAYDKATERLAEKIASEKGITKNEAYRTVEYKSSEEKSSFDKYKVDLDRAREDYNDVLTGKTLERAKRAFEAAEKELNEKIKLYGTLEELKLSLANLEKQELEAAGSSKCFILLAKTFGIPDKVKTIKFIILLYVSLLVELCIWLSSPDLRLDGGLLYSYRNDLGLSTKKDVDKLLKEIKDTNTRFSSKEEEVKIVEKIPERVHKEMDNLKEQIEILNREKIENETIVKDLHIQYQDQIDKLQNQIKDDSLEEEYMDQIRLLTEKANKFEEEKNEQKNKVADLENELSDSKKKITSLNDELVQTSNNKYSDSDIKAVIKKTAEKSKEEIKKLKDQIAIWEDNYNNLKSSNDNLKITNSSLEKVNQELNYKNEALMNSSFEEEPKKKLSDIKIGTLEEEAKGILGDNIKKINRSE